MLNITHFREMQMETTVRYHFTPVRIAIIKKFTNNKCWRGCEEKGTLLHCWWKCKLIQPIWKRVWRFLKKLGKNQPCNPTISLQLIKINGEEKKRKLKKKKNTILKHTCVPIFTAAILTIGRTWLQPRCSATDKWIKKCGTYV